MPLYDALLALRAKKFLLCMDEVNICVLYLCNTRAYYVVSVLWTVSWEVKAHD